MNVIINVEQDRNTYNELIKKFPSTIHDGICVKQLVLEEIIGDSSTIDDESIKENSS